MFLERATRVTPEMSTPACAVDATTLSESGSSPTAPMNAVRTPRRARFAATFRPAPPAPMRTVPRLLTPGCSGSALATTSMLAPPRTTTEYPDPRVERRTPSPLSVRRLANLLFFFGIGHSVRGRHLRPPHETRQHENGHNLGEDADELIRNGQPDYPQAQGVEVAKQRGRAHRAKRPPVAEDHRGQRDEAPPLSHPLKVQVGLFDG